MAIARTQRADHSISAEPVNVWALLDAALGDRVMPRPENSVTPEELAAKHGVSACYASHQLRQQVAAGTLKKVYFRSAINRKQVCFVPADNPTK